MKRTLILLISAFLCQFQSFAQAKSFIHKGQTRDYILHLPSSYTSIKSYPLIINMHGNGSNAIQQQAYSGMDIIADTANFIVVYPNGLSATWNSGFFTPYNSGTDDVGFLSALIDTMAKNYTIDLCRVYSIGMSMGGFMSHRMACDLENRIAAIASVTGSMGNNVKINCNLSRPVPVMQIHGTADGTVPYQGSPGYLPVDSIITFWVKKDNCPATAVVTNIPDIVNEGSTVTKYYYGLGNDSSEVILFKVQNGGHTWPGAAAVPSLGNTNQDIKASAEIWKFLKKHRIRNCTITSVPDRKVSTELRCFPNPFYDHLNISGNKIAKISIYNLLGQEIQIIQSPSTTEISTSTLKEGIYFIKVEAENKTSVFKVIKE